MTYYVGQVPALSCSATGRTCKGTVTGTVPSGKTKLGLRSKRGETTGEWSFRVSVSDDPNCCPRLLESDGPALAVSARRRAVPRRRVSVHGAGLEPRCAIDRRTRRMRHPSGSFRASRTTRKRAPPTLTATPGAGCPETTRVRTALLVLADELRQYILRREEALHAVPPCSAPYDHHHDSNTYRVKVEGI